MLLDQTPSRLFVHCAFYNSQVSKCWLGMVASGYKGAIVDSLISIFDTLGRLSMVLPYVRDLFEVQ